MTKGTSPRLIYMGTPTFAVPALNALIHAGYSLVAVYSQPPRPKNRGYQVTQSPVHAIAEAAGIPVFTPVSLKTTEAQEIFRSHNADLAIVAAYGLILPQAILDIPRLGCLNIHGSLLPAWRGAAPIHRAILAGDTVTGITLMQMDAGLDTGSMLAKSTYSLSATDTFPKIHDDLAALGAELLMHTLPTYFDGNISPEPQKNDRASYAAKLKKAEGLLNFYLPAEQVLRCVRALNPWPGTRTVYRGEILKILDASVVMENTTTEDVPHTYLTKRPGTILKNGRIMCGDTTILQILTIQRAGGKPMPIQDFLRGSSLIEGEFFGEEIV